MAWVCVRENAEISKPSPRENKRKKKQVIESNNGCWNFTPKWRLPTKMVLAIKNIEITR